MRLMPFDPRDPSVLPVPLPATDQSVLSARAANEADRRRYVKDVARTGPRYGLEAILDQFPQDLHRDVLVALSQYQDLCEDHGPSCTARTLMKYRLEVHL